MTKGEEGQKWHFFVDVICERSQNRFSVHRDRRNGYTYDWEKKKTLIGVNRKITDLKVGKDHLLSKR